MQRISSVADTASTATIYVLGLLTVVMLNGCASIAPRLSEGEVASYSTYLGQRLASAVQPLDGKLTVGDAVARAVRYNATIRAKELEAALAEAHVRSRSGEMLPNLVAETRYYQRDRAHSSRSSQSTVYSTSSDLSTLSSDITLSWNILDFGLSFIRAKQGLDKAHQQHEDVRRVSARIGEETRSLYWKAVASAKLGPAAAGLAAELDEAVRLSRAAAADPALDPLVAIDYQRDILALRRDLSSLQTSLAGTTAQLNQSIGMPLSGKLTLESSERLPKRALPASTVAEDVSTALRQRPEIRQHMYDMRITENEVDAVFLRLLPGATLSGTAASDSTSFLLHSDWIEASTRIAGNLMNLVRLPAELDTLDAQQSVHRQNALASAATIMMQVHVARARIEVQMRAFRDAERFADVQRQLYRQVRAAVQAGKVGRQALVREKLATLLTQVRMLVAFADLDSAFAAYATARGDDPVPLQSAGAGRGAMSFAAQIGARVQQPIPAQASAAALP